MLLTTLLLSNTGRSIKSVHFFFNKIVQFIGTKKSMNIWRLSISVYITPNIGLTLTSIPTQCDLFTNPLCKPTATPFVLVTSHNRVSSQLQILNREPRVCKGFYGTTQYIQGYGVVLQEGVRIWSVQQRAELLPSGLSKGVAELLGQFLWRVYQRELFLQGTAPQLHLQLKLRNCFFTMREAHRNFN